MYRQIQVAVDGSSISNLALLEAVKLAKELGSRLRIVHVVDLVTVKLASEVGDLSGIQEMLKAFGEKVLEKALTLAREAGGEPETKLVQVAAFDERIPELIVREANAWPADLIVMGSHGHRGYRHPLLGGVAQGVVHSATCPVLLVRGK